MSDIAEEIFEENYPYKDDTKCSPAISSQEWYANRYHELKPQFVRHIIGSFLSVTGAFVSCILHDKLHEHCITSSKNPSATPLSLGTPFLFLLFVFIIFIFKNFLYFIELFAAKAKSEGKILPFEQHPEDEI